MADESLFTWVRKDNSVRTEKKDGFELKYYVLIYHYKGNPLPASESRKEYIEDDQFKAWREYQKIQYHKRMEIAKMW